MHGVARGHRGEETAKPIRALAIGLAALAVIAAAGPTAVAQTPGAFELVGHNPLMNRGMNSALAVHGNYAYIGNRTDGTHANPGVLVVDISNPAAPRVVHEIGPPNQGNPSESSRELRVWPEQNLLLVLNHGCNELIHRCANAANAGRTPLPSNIRFYDIAGANGAAPKLVATYMPSRAEPQQPHEFFLWDDHKRDGRALLYLTTPSAPSRENLIVTDISGARDGKFQEIGKWSPEPPGPGGTLHSLGLSNDGTRAYLAYLGGGFFIVDTSDFAAAAASPQVRPVTPVENAVAWGEPGAHSAVKLFGRDYALTTDEVYGRFGGVLSGHGCPWGWTRLIDIKDPSRPAVVSEYKVLPFNDRAYCNSVSQDRNNFSSLSAHNPTLTPNLALITWHSAGLQAISLENPAAPTQAAVYMPTPLPVVQTEDPALSSGPDKVVMWSYPIVKDGLIYVVDLRNGLYVLRYRGPFEEEVASTRFLEGNSNLGDALRFEPPGSAPPGAGPPPPAIGARPPGVTVTPEGPRRLLLSRRAHRVTRRGVVQVRALCRSGFACRGILRLVMRQRPRRGQAVRELTLARKRFVVERRRRSVISLRLSPAARRVVRRARRVRALAIANLEPERPGAPSTTETTTFRLVGRK